MGVLERYSAANSDGSVSVGQPVVAIALGQSFQAPSSSPLNDCSFYLSKYGSPTGGAVAKLYDHSGTFGSTSVPTGDPLATSDPISVENITGTFANYNFHFSTPYTLSSGSYYVIVIYYDEGDVSNYLLVGRDASTLAHAGNQCSYLTSWNYNDAQDVVFSLYTGTGVQVRQVGTAIGNDAQAITPYSPVDYCVGDLLLVCIGSYCDTVQPFWAPVDTNWWTEFYHLSSRSAGYSIAYACGRFAEAGNEYCEMIIAGYGVVDVETCAVIIAFYNVSTVKSDDVTENYASFDAPSSPYDITISTFDTNTDGAMALMMWVSNDDNTWQYYSGGGEEILSFDNTAGGDNSFLIAGKAMPTAGAVGAQVGRQTNKAGDEGVWAIFGLRPASADGLVAESLMVM